MDSNNRRPAQPRSSSERSPARQKKKKLLNEQQLRKTKLYVFLFAFIVAMGFLSYKIYQLKSDHGNNYTARVLDQLLERDSLNQTLTAKRGAILDRNRQPLAVSTLTYDIILDVRTLMNFESETSKKSYASKSAEEKQKIQQNRLRTLEIIHQVLSVNYGFANLDMETLQSYIVADSNTLEPTYNTMHLILARQVPRKAAVELTDALKAEKLSHVYALDTYKREYLHDNLASAVLGFIRNANSWGLERQYNDLLTGTPGRTFGIFGEAGSVEVERVEPTNGYSLITTLDLTIQQSAERICEKYAELYDAPFASAIVMNPHTAELYALAQYPSVNLNAPDDVSFINKESYAATWDTLPESEKFDNLDSIWANFNVSSTFEPGSIYKPMTVAAALEEGLIRTDQTFFCNGERWYGNTRVPCHKEGGHQEQTLEEAIANSCNVAMMEIAEALGRETFYAYLLNFGYGERTSIDLPAESIGVLHPYQNFHTVELAVASFGQRFNCTPMQALTSFCSIINGGNVMRPYVVSQVIDDNGQIISENKPLIQRKVISKKTSDYLRKAMEAVIQPTGTGRKAAIEGWAIGGKTATGQQGIPGSDDYAFSLSFITYFPVENPQYAVLVLLHNVSEEIYDDGAASAAAMSKELMLDIIKYKTIPPTYPIADAAAHSTESITMEDFTGKSVAEVTKRLNALNLDYDLVGGNCAVVTSQFPLGGMSVPTSTTVFLTAGSQEGVALVEVPNVTAMTVAEATTALEALGLSPYVVSTDIDDAPTASPADAGISKTIETQMPEPGIRVMYGTEIRLKTDSK